jgi:hypothetical protein
MLIKITTSFILIFIFTLILQDEKILLFLPIILRDMPGAQTARILYRHLWLNHLRM